MATAFQRGSVRGKGTQYKHIQASGALALRSWTTAPRLCIIGLARRTRRAG